MEFVCDRCGAKANTCIHSKDEDYCIELREDYISYNKLCKNLFVIFLLVISFGFIIWRLGC